MNIYLAYKKKIHPLKIVMLDHRDAMLLAEGIRESLTKDDRNVKVEITIENRNVRGNRDRMFSLRLMPRNIGSDLIDSIQNIGITDEIMRIDNNEAQFSIEDPSSERTLTVIPERPNRIKVIIVLDSYQNESKSITKIYDIKNSNGKTLLEDVTGDAFRLDFVIEDLK